MKDQALLEGVLAGLANGVAIINHSGVIVDQNPALSRLLGCAPSELVDITSLLSHFDLGQRTAVETALLGPMGAQPFEAVVEISRADKLTSFATVRIWSTNASDGSPHRVVSLRDVTELKHAEHEASLVQERWRAITETSFDYVSTLDRQYRFLTVNRVAERVREEDLIGKVTPLAFTDARYHDLMRDAFERTFREGSISICESRSVDQSTWFLNIVGPIYDNGAVVAISVLTRDITEKKNVEQERARIDALLQRAQRMETLATLAGGIAHDFNNLLMPILGNTEMAMQSMPEDDKRRLLLQDAMIAATRAREIVRKVMVIGRRSTDPHELVRIQDLAREAVRFLQPTMPSGVQFEFDLDDSAPPIAAITSRIHQAITNLCANSWQAMEQRGGRIVVRLKRRAIDHITAATEGIEPGPALSLIVEDNGPGMSPEVLERACEPFFTTKSVGQGTGLGLPMVHAAVTEHGGSLTISSEAGKGTRVELLLPVRAEARADTRATGNPTPNKKSNATATQRSADKGASSAPSSLQIVCVDDEPTVLRLIERVLQRGGHDVTTFSSPWAALEHLSNPQSHVDVVVTDQAMPELTGLGLASKLYALRSDVPVVIVSGYRVGGFDEAEAGNVRAWLDKPVSGETLISAVTHAVRQQRASITPP